MLVYFVIMGFCCLFVTVQGSSNEELRQAYDTLLSAMVEFRSYHIQIVTKWVVVSVML